MWRPILLVVIVVSLTACGVSRGAQQNSHVLEVAYALQILDGDGKTQTVREDATLRSGDRFALLVKTSSPLHLYLFNRGRGDSSYRRLFPASGQDPRVGTFSDSPLRLPQDRESWMRLDKRSGNEHLVLIASKMPLEKLENATSIRRDQVEDTLAEIERNQRPRDLERREDGNWTRWKTETQRPGMVLVCRIPLLHR
jgi:hypothetical protein